MNQSAAAAKQMKVARVGLILDQPFWGSLALRLETKEDPTCPTGWTDGKSLGYNPDWIMELTLDQTKGFIAHEIEHIIFKHNTRRGDRDHMKWNIAGDYVINGDLERTFSLPPGGLLNAQFTGHTADHVYNQLPDPPKGGGGGGGGDGEGGTVFGEVRDLPGPPDKNGKAPKASPGQARQFEKEMEIAIVQAKNQAKARGMLPGGIERLIDELVAPKLDWRVILRRFAEENSKNGYSWQPPNRRFIHQGFYFPSLQSKDVGKIVCAIDTSGSVSQHELAQFAAELQSITDEFESELHVMYCDSQYHGKQVFQSGEPVKVVMRGGGGTAFTPIFEEIEKEEPPTFLLYMTDLCCDDFPQEPGYPVMWVRTGGGSYSCQPPWGEVLDLEGSDD